MQQSFQQTIFRVTTLSAASLLSCFSHLGYAQEAMTEAPAGNATGVVSSPAPEVVVPVVHHSFRLIPDFHEVPPGITPTRLTASDKLWTGLQNSFGLPAIAVVAAEAGVRENDNALPAFRNGATGYGRYYWHGFVDHTDEDLLVQSLLPIAFHEDNRYYILGHGTIPKRAGYAISRFLITRDDSGHSTLNVSEIVGSGAAAGISASYYPGQYRNWTRTGQRWVTNLGFDDALFVLKEFWPDIRHGIFRH